MRSLARRAARGTAVVLLPVGLGMMTYGSGLVPAEQRPAEERPVALAEVPAASVAEGASTSPGAPPSLAPRSDARNTDATRVGVAGRSAGRTAPTRLRTPAPPTSLRIGSIALEARVVPIEVTADGVLDPPADATRLGWWERSAPLGAARGQTVVTGRAVAGGQAGGEAAMNELGDVQPGAVVRALHADQVQRYTVTSVTTWSSEQLSERAERLFAQDRQRGRLVLVTPTARRGDTWRSAVVVLATPGRGAR